MTNRPKSVKDILTSSDEMKAFIRELEQNETPLTHLLILRVETAEFKVTISKMFVRLALLLGMQGVLLALILYNVLNILELLGSG
jgi:hypothetical protein